MNIFVLDQDPKIAAQMACDKHIVKMPLETAQMLCTIYHKNNLNAPYKRTHEKHPCTLWAGISKENYDWLYEHGLSLSKEYTFRYGKVHACESIIKSLVSKNISFKWPSMTKFALAMPDQYKDKLDPVKSYRNYYIGDKKPIATWKNREIPDWFV